MNIILDKSLKTDSKQPKVFELGQITTTLQDLLDNSTIVINGEQTIILSVIDENDNVLKYLLPLDYKGESFYGLGQNILESDLISLTSVTQQSGGDSRPYMVYSILLSHQAGEHEDEIQILENTFDKPIVVTFENNGPGKLFNFNCEYFVPSSKIFCFKGQNETEEYDSANFKLTFYNFGFNIQLTMGDAITGMAGDYSLYKLPLEIRKYV